MGRSFSLLYREEIYPGLLPFVENVYPCGEGFMTRLTNAPKIEEIKRWIINPINRDEIIMIIKYSPQQPELGRSTCCSKSTRMMVYNTKTNDFTPVSINNGFIFCVIMQSFFTTQSDNLIMDEINCITNKTHDDIVYILSEDEYDMWYDVLPNQLILSGIISRFQHKPSAQFMTILDITQDNQKNCIFTIVETKFVTFPADRYSNRTQRVKWTIPFDCHSCTKNKNWVFGIAESDCKCMCNIHMWPTLNSHHKHRGMSWNLKLNASVFVLFERLYLREMIALSKNNVAENNVRLLLFGNCNIRGCQEDSFLSTIRCVDIKLPNTNNYGSDSYDRINVDYKVLDQSNVDEMLGFNLSQNKSIVDMFSYYTLFDFKVHYVDQKYLLIMGGFFQSLEPYKQYQIPNKIVAFHFETRKWSVLDIILPVQFDKERFLTLQLKNKVLIAQKKPISNGTCMFWQLQLNLCACVKWEIERLVWLGYLKNSDNAMCLFDSLPKDIILYILQMLCSIKKLCKHSHTKASPDIVTHYQ